MFTTSTRFMCKKVHPHQVSQLRYIVKRSYEGDKMRAGALTRLQAESKKALTRGQRELVRHVHVHVD